MTVHEAGTERTNCDLCEKHCPVGAFGCGRGERAYGGQDGGEQPSTERGHGEHGHGERIHGGHGSHGRRGRHGRPEGEGHRRQAPRAEGAAQPEGLAGKLIEAGRVAQIKAEHIAAAGKSADVMFRVIEQEDAVQLEELLDSLLAAWQQAHAAHHGREGGGHGGSKH
ncbi:MAG: hypothetical protein ACI4OC_04985 [Coriobacteriales bacterium]